MEAAGCRKASNSGTTVLQVSARITSARISSRAHLAEHKDVLGLLDLTGLLVLAEATE
jgi:hypothetical protein